MERKVTIIAEPINKHYVDSFEELLKENPCVADRMKRCKKGRKVYWESKEVFNEDGRYNIDENGKSLKMDIYKMGKGVNEFMCVIENYI